MSQFFACFWAKEANSRLSTANRVAKWKRKLVGAATHQRTRLNRLFAPSAGMNAKLVKRANCIYREGERVSDTCKRNTSAKTQIRSCSYGPAIQFQYVANYNNCRDPAEELTHTHLGSCGWLLDWIGGGVQVAEPRYTGQQGGSYWEKRWFLGKVCSFHNYVIGFILYYIIPIPKGYVQGQLLNTKDTNIET